MRKAVYYDFGDAEAMVLEDVPVPEPGAGEVRIAVRAAGCNRNDALKVAGHHHARPILPLTPGAEVAGVVSAIGPNVTRFAIGDRVLAIFLNSVGGWCEEVVTRVECTAKIPDFVPYEVAATFQSSYITAYDAVVNTADVRAGDTVLVTGAGGGVGLAAVEICRALGATVIAVAGSDKRLAAAAEAGADHQIDHSRQSVHDEVMRITDGRMADVIIEVVGGDMLREAMRCIAWRGRLTLTGFATFEIPEIRPILILLKGFDLRGINMTQTIRHQPGAMAHFSEQLFRWYARGQIRPRIARTFPLEQAAGALGFVQERDHIGKVAITM